MVIDLPDDFFGVWLAWFSCALKMCEVIMCNNCLGDWLVVSYLKMKNQISFFEKPTNWHENEFLPNLIDKYDG